MCDKKYHLGSFRNVNVSTTQIEAVARSERRVELTLFTTSTTAIFLATEFPLLADNSMLLIDATGPVTLYGSLAKMAWIVVMVAGTARLSVIEYSPPQEVK